MFLMNRPSARCTGIKRLYMMADKRWFKTTKKIHSFEIPCYYVSRYEDELHK